jgi:hypothetical protein
VVMPPFERPMAQDENPESQQTLAPSEPSEDHADKDNIHQDHKCDEHAKRPGVSVRSRPTLPGRASNRLRVHSGTTNTETHCCGDQHDRLGSSLLIHSLND